MIAEYSFGMSIIILMVSIITGAILLLAPGSIRLQRPETGWTGWMFNIMNLSFFLILIPLSGLLLIRGIYIPYLVCVNLPHSPLRIAFEVVGLFLFLSGSTLLLWSRLSLRRSFRLAGVKPGQNDYLTLHGPYKKIRHPMYLSALLVLLGLTLILSSVLLTLMFIVMFWLVRRLIPEEEIQLDQAYPIAYAEYCKRVPGAMFPLKRK